MSFLSKLSGLSLNIKEANSSYQNLSFSNDEDDLLLWHVNIKDIGNSFAFNELMQSLSSQERQKVMKFHFPEDRKRALLSILLQRKMICQRFDVEDFEYQISRTTENKPFVKMVSMKIGTWNYNVSHHGDYVCIASHSNLLIGVDLVDTLTRSGSSRSAATFVDMFRGQLTVGEYQAINSMSSDSDKYSLFFVVWSLKEAFIKAIGSGLGFDLTQIDFEVHFPPSPAASCSGSQQQRRCEVNQSLRGHATARIFGQRRDDWRFEFSGLDERHILTVARGPVSDAIPSYQQAAGWTQHSSAKRDAQLKQHQTLLSRPVTESQSKTVHELLPIGFSYPSNSPMCISEVFQKIAIPVSMDTLCRGASEECKSGVSPSLPSPLSRPSCEASSRDVTVQC